MVIVAKIEISHSELMSNYTLYLTLLFTYHLNKYFVLIIHELPNYCTPMILNVFMVFVKSL